MKKDINSQIKFNCILSIIGLILCAICLIVEIIIKGNSITFWIILFICNLVILITNLTQREKKKK